MKKLFVAALYVAALTFTTINTVEAKEHIVKVVTDYENLRMAFEPKSIAINPGDTVTWVNEVDESHNIMTYPDGYPSGAQGFASPFMNNAGDRWSQTFATKGTYEYHCVPHMFMGMRGRVIVGESSFMDEMNKPTREEVTKYRTMLLEFFDPAVVEDAVDIQVRKE